MCSYMYHVVVYKDITSTAIVIVKVLSITKNLYIGAGNKIIIHA